MHSRLPYEVNQAILDLAARRTDLVCGLDLAGPDILYGEKLDELADLFARARSLDLNTTGHLFETVNGCHPKLLPYLKRIGHGIQIPLRFPELLPDLAERGQCLEVCPTTYLKTGTLSDLGELRTVFDLCERNGVDIVLCTDNAGLHNVRLPFEIENLLVEDIIDFRQLRACQEAAFKHAFAWPHPLPPQKLLASISAARERKAAGVEPA
jgi:adenosine deaminase